MNRIPKNHLELAEAVEAETYNETSSRHRDLDLDLERQDAYSANIPSLKPSTHSTAYLDGLRGLAALLVYIFHNLSWFSGADNDVLRGYGDQGIKLFATLPFVRIVFNGGSAAVAVFFVLSGFVLSTSPLATLRAGKRGQCWRSLISSTIRRPFRLFIPPIGVSLVMVLLMQLPASFSPHFSWPEPKNKLSLELTNWVFELGRAFNPFEEHGIFTHWFPYDPPVWTMAIEYKGSMLVFIMIALSSFVRPSLRLALFGLSGILLLSLYQWAMALFMAGMVLALNEHAGYDQFVFRILPNRLKSILFHLIFILGWWLACQPAGERDASRSLNSWGWARMTKMVPNIYYTHEYWRFWHSWGAFLIVFGVLKIQWMQRLLSIPTLRYLGYISFSLYLTHMPLIWILGDRIYRLFGAVKVDSGFKTPLDNRFLVPDVGPRGMSLRFVVAQAFILPISLYVAEITTVLLDEPSVKFGRWLVSKFQLTRGDVPSRQPNRRTA